MNVFVTFQVGNLAPPAIQPGQPDQLHIGPVAFADLDHGELTVGASADDGENNPVAWAEGALCESGALETAWRIDPDYFDSLESYRGMCFSRALIHTGDIPAFDGRPVPLFQPPTHSASPQGARRKMALTQC